MAKGEKRDTEKAASIVRDAGGRVVGRTRLQKMAFLLEITGLGDGFNFEYRHYGPYSEQLANAVSTAAIAGLISEEERATDWGGSYSIFTASPNPDMTVSEARRELISCAVSADPIALELAATAAFLANEGESAPWNETARRKPEKAESSLDDAKVLYSKLQEVPTPVPLPLIGQSLYRSASSIVVGDVYQLPSGSR